MRKFFLLVILFIFFLEFDLVNGTIVDKVYNSNQRYVSVTSFGFLKGGTLDVSITSENRNTWFLFCTSNEINTLFNYSPDVCAIVANSSCTLALPFSSSLTVSQFVVPQYGMYYVELLDCEDPTIHATAHLVLLNPDSDHLSFGYIPYPSLFSILCVVWFAFIATWISNWVIYRLQPSKLNRIITILPLFKIIYCGFGAFYWRTFSIEGMVPDKIEDTFILFIILQEAIFYAILMIISCGWGIVSNQIKAEKYIIIGVILGLMITRSLGYLINGLFFIMSFLTYVVIIVMLFRFVNFHLQMLHIELRDNPPPISNDGSLRNPIAEKESKLKSFKVIILSFIAFLMMIQLFELTFFRDYPWVYDMLRELLDLTIFICVCYVFRLQDPTVYYLLDDEAQS